MAKYLNLDGLQTLWAKLKDTFALKKHSHAYDDITGKPTSFTPAAHTHGANMAEITTSDVGDGDVTDGTDLVTSYADENGYTTGHPKVYRRKAIKLWNYIKGKLTSVSGVNVSGSSTKLEIAGKISASDSNFHDAQYALVATSADAGDAAQISCYRFNNGSSSNNSPFGDGMVINIPWSSKYGVQIAIEDNSYTEYKRYLNGGTWSSWFRTMNSDGYAGRVKRVGCCQWDAGDSAHIGSFTCSADALANYSNFLVHNGDNTPTSSTPFIINSNYLNGETWYSFKFPKGGTLRYNNQRTSTVWIKYNGDSPSVNAGKTYDFHVAPGGVLELYWNWGSGLYVVCDTPKKDVGDMERPVYLKDGKITQCIVGFKINELSTSGSYISFV